jgi:fermentation-respiration switch protein FrsA (DUF1100 family)
MKTPLLSKLVPFLVIYLSALIGTFIFQRNFLYFPSPIYMTPREAQAPSAFQEITFTTEDGLALKSWYAPATSKPLTLVFFHGNGDTLRTVAPIAAPFINAGYGFLLTEYRGYSGLPGKPTEEGLYADARANIHQLILQGIDPHHIILFGYSLGTGVAVQMATEFPVGGVILAAPYTSMADMAQVRFPIFPARYMVLDRFDNEKKIAGLTMPLLMGNGGRDAVVPPAQGQKLFAEAQAPKQFYVDPNAGHTDLFTANFYTSALQWLDQQSKNKP